MYKSTYQMTEDAFHVPSNNTHTHKLDKPNCAHRIPVYMNRWPDEQLFPFLFRILGNIGIWVAAMTIKYRYVWGQPDKDEISIAKKIRHLMTICILILAMKYTAME